MELSGESRAFDRTEMVQDEDSPFIPIGGWSSPFTEHLIDMSGCGSRDELNQSSPSRQFILAVAGWGVFKWEEVSKEKSHDTHLSCRETDTLL